MMIYRRGDVVVVYFPHSDGETWKPRPALVVEGDDIETGLPQKILAQISSKVDKRKGETRVVVLQNSPIGKEMGLRTDSVVVTDNLRTVEHRLIYKKIGYCSDMEAVNTALKRALGLE
jgi:mRNA interferase MazF